MSFDLPARAKRVQSLRNMTKLSRREFAKKTGIPHSTMQHWEDGDLHALPEKSISRLINAFHSLGIHCSRDWLLHGHGIAPKYIFAANPVFEKNSSKKIHKLSIATPSEPNQIKQEIALFLQHHKDAVDFIVPDNAMEPRFATGEHVAGIRYYKNDIEKLIGMDCIVLIKNGNMHLRRILKSDVAGYYHLTTTNPNANVIKPFFSDIELVSAAPVIWARRQCIIEQVENN